MNSRIPNVFHFVFGLRKQTEPFHLVFYLCLESCLRVQNPEALYLYYHYEPYGPYWDLIKGRITLVRIHTNEFVDQFQYQDRFVKKYSYAHQSDFVRLEKLIEYGGVYADIDTIFVNPLPAHLFDQSFVLGKEDDIVEQGTGETRSSLCNAFIMSERDSSFGQQWLHAMAGAFDGSWSRHSTLLPYELSQAYPESIHIEPPRTFYKHMWTLEGIHTLFEGCDADFEGVVSFHLWSHLWWEKRRKDFSDFHAELISEEHIRREDTTYNLVARRFLPDESIIKRTSCLKDVSTGIAGASSEIDEEIDAVYLWVDGDDPAFRSQCIQALRGLTSEDGMGSIAPHHFRDNGELRYSLRSLHQFAPWVRRIHIVTNGQIPSWLDTSHGKIAVVTHDMIFDNAAHLPTFNSNAIEMQLHKISGLSKRFLYLNDDVFLGKPISKADFLTQGGGQYLYVDDVTFPSGQEAVSVHDRSYVHTRRVLDHFQEFYRFPMMPAHTPQLYDRGVLADVQEMLSSAVEETASHQFRSAEDLVLRILYSGYLFGAASTHSCHRIRSLRSGSSDYSFVTLTPHAFHEWQTFRHIMRAQPRFFCMNDELDDRWGSRFIQKRFARFLLSYFPNPSPFEKRGFSC